MPLTELDGRDDLALAIDLLNTWDTFPEPHDALRSVDVLRRLLRHHGRERAAAAAREADVVRARRLRERLRRAWSARDEDAAVAALNEILARAPAPHLVRDRAGWRFGWDESTPSFLGPATATALLEAIRARGWRRFGVCAAGPCTCVYVDRSRAATRRYCCTLCADRANQASSRARSSSSR
jgi:predicted RNA-binding Zn ribbon-like protein